MPKRTRIVKTMAPGLAKDSTREEGSVLRTKNEDQSDQPDLDYEAKRSFQQSRKQWRPRKTDDIPPGMEGFYYLP